MLYSTKLTPSQANYLQSLMPKHYSIQEVTSDGKRQRSVKKFDEIFVTDYEPAEKKTPVKVQRPTAVQRLGQKASEEEAVDDVENNQQKDQPVEDGKAASSIKKERSPQKKALNAQLITAILERLKKNKCSVPFRTPVDPIAQGVPDYQEVIKDPMDLKTIQRKLKNGQYLSNQEVHQDIRKIISNSYMFNQNEPSYLAITKDFQALYLKIKQKYQKREDNDCFSPKEQQPDLSASPQKKGRNAKPKEEKKTSSSISAPQSQKSSSMAQKISPRERQKLFHQIYELPQKDIISLLKIVDNSVLSKNWNQFQIDFKDLDDDKFRKIINLVKERS